MGCGVQLLILIFNLLIFSSNGKPNGVCVSPGGRFPPFSSEGKPPRKVTKGLKDLTLCRVFRRSTCCDVAQTHPALLSVRRLASNGEANQECVQLWELLECSICDPRVGIQPGPPLICASFCERVFHACSNAYFSMDAQTQVAYLYTWGTCRGVGDTILYVSTLTPACVPYVQVMSPCGLSDFVCGIASEWVSNGTEFCRFAGFSVKPSEDYQDEEVPSCYGGKASLDSIANSWRASQAGVPQKNENIGVFEDFQQWVKEMPFRERVLWAVGGMVLTAGILFVSKRKSHSQRQKKAASLRAVKRLEAAMSRQSSVNQGNRKGSGR